MRLGTLCPRLSEWQSLFPHDVRLQRALDAFYAAVIRFCTRAVQVLDRTGMCYETLQASPVSNIS
jgi:hypothetical protein